ncbi:MAG: LysM peptidoglycan-binding domain-containing protein [Lachnospiraceae bacterium]|nr:LysM peptidoglycan-binding domain-containing protein [Lachnospiraceae bacterium]
MYTTYANTDNKRHINSVLIRAKRRRFIQKRNMMVRFAISLLIVMSVMSFTVSLRSFALANENSGPTYKYYTSYTVQPGDNLRSISKEFISKEYSSVHEYISEVVNINHLISASQIQSGQVLYLPYYSSEIK